MPAAPVPILDNRSARRLFLHRHALAEPPSGNGRGADLLDLVTRLGFVQIDSVNTLARAHDLILFARRPAYRPKSLQWLLERDRSLFEHWTHDAAAVPTAFLPHWKNRFARRAERLAAKWEEWQGHSVAERVEEVLAHIEANGCCGSGELAEGPRPKGGWWEWHPSKTAMEYLWHTGTLAIARRENFRKKYDLAHRVLPQVEAAHPDETMDFLCHGAVARLGFATPGEIANFWAHHAPHEVKPWVSAALSEGRLIEVDVEGVDGKLRRSLAFPDVIDAARDAPEPVGRLRVLSPFDPALRDRARAERLFGFRYRIEIFVPAEKRIFGYYVFPILEGDRLVGRIDMRADRDADAIVVTALWPERGLRWGKGRQTRLEAELQRLTRLAGVRGVRFEDGWLRDTVDF